MITHSIFWRRLDGPGQDACRLEHTATGWNVTGVAEFSVAEERAEIHYLISCGFDFRTDSASLHGSLGQRAVTFEIERTKNGDGWSLNGSLVSGLEGCIDVDLGFTPATNLLPIRRLALREGDHASAPAAWLDVTRGSLHMLPQVYERRSAFTYWYEAPSVGYCALLEVSASGFVLDYPGLWRAEQCSE